MNRNIRRLTEGAMMCGLIGLILVINRQFANAFDAYMMWIVPLPLIVYTIRYGIKNAFVVTFCATALSFMIALPQTVFYVLASCLIGIVYGYGVRNEKSNQWLLGHTILASTLIMIVTAVLFAGLFGYDLGAELQLVLEMTSSMNVAIAENMARVLLYASLFLTCILEGFLIHMIAYIVLIKLKIKVKGFTPLLQYRVPKWFAFISVVSIIGNMVVPYFTQNTQILEILLCVSSICSVIAILFGYLLVMMSIRVTKKRYSIFVFFALFLLFPKYVLFLLIVLGLIDMLTDIRDEMIRRIAHENQSGKR